MTLISDEVVEMSIRSLGAINVPSILRDRIEKHQQHLMALASSLLVGGQSKETVRHTIEIVMESFKLELMATIEGLMETLDAC